MKEKNTRKRTVGDVIRNIVLVIAIGVFLFSAYRLFMIYMEYKAGTDEYDKMRTYVTAPELPKQQEKVPAKEEEQVEKLEAPKIDFAGLQAINPDIIGWIQLEAIDISYPIVQGKDNDHYLHYTFEGKKNGAGSIFLESSNKADFSDCNTMIYGHNMKNGSMFGKLREFHEEQTYATSPYLWVCTPSGSYRYEIFSYHTTSATGDTYTLFSAPGEEFQTYLNKMKENSEIANDVAVTQTDKIITLSTCTGNDATRFVVQAKRLPEVY